MTHTPGPFGQGMDLLARSRGGWPDHYMVYAVEVIGNTDAADPQVMLIGSAASWMPRAKRWKFEGPNSKAVIQLTEYRAALPSSAIARATTASKEGEA